MEMLHPGRMLRSQRSAAADPTGEDWLGHSSEAAFGAVVFVHGGAEVGRREIGPHAFREDQFGVRGFPEQEIAQALFAAGPDQQIDRKAGLKFVFGRLRELRRARSSLSPAGSADFGNDWFVSPPDRWQRAGAKAGGRRRPMTEVRTPASRKPHRLLFQITREQKHQRSTSSGGRFQLSDEKAYTVRTPILRRGAVSTMLRSASASGAMSSDAG